MKKNSHIHFVLETEFMEKLKIEAKEKIVSVSQLCRQKIRESYELKKIEDMLKILLENANTNKSNN